MQARAQFPPEPRSASAARHWVRDHLNQIGRTDLVPSAEAGVSELVTNGILHAQTSIGLALSRYRERVIIEVYDGSPMSQQPAVDTATPHPVESTIGRGLRIVRANAQEWGVSTTRNGKAIWFQPAASDEARDATLESSLAEMEDDLGTDLAFDLDTALDALAEAFPDDSLAAESPPDEHVAGADDLVRVRLLGVPPWLVHHYRKRWLELHREMQLVALAEPSAEQEMAQQFCDAAQAVQADMYVVEGSAVGQSRAVSDDGAAVDAVFDVPRSRRRAFVAIRDHARALERNWAGARLLFVHPGPQAAQLREWWLGQFIAQIDGEPPTPWPGQMRVCDEAIASGGDA